MILFCLLLCWSGFYLAVGFVDGVVKVLDPCTLEEEGEGSFKYSHDCITHLAFSHDSSYLAAAVSVHSWWNLSNSNRISYDQACPLQLYNCIQYITTFKMYSLHATHTIKYIIPPLSFSWNHFPLQDTGKAVMVFHLCKDGTQYVWHCLGKHRSHYKPIQDLLFGVYLDSTRPRLLSLGMDRRLVSSQWKVLLTYSRWFKLEVRTL